MRRLDVQLAQFAQETEQTSISSPTVFRYLAKYTEIDLMEPTPACNDEFMDSERSRDVVLYIAGNAISGDVLKI